MGSGGPGDRFKARHVRGEACDSNPRVVAPDEVCQRAAQIRLGARGAGPQCVRRIPDQCENPFIAKPGQRRLVCGRTDQRVRIELPIPGMQNRPDRRPERDRIRFGNGMGQGDQFEVERADREPAGHRHDVDPDPVGKSGFDELGA